MSKQRVGAQWQRANGLSVRVLVFLTTLLVMVSHISQDAYGEVRIWTESDSERTVEAEFDGFEGDEVVLVRTVDHRRFTIPLDRLSEKDRAFVADITLLADGAELRMWTDATSRRPVEARLLARRGAMVLLQDADRRFREARLDQFSPADRTYIDAAVRPPQVSQPESQNEESTEQPPQEDGDSQAEEASGRDDGEETSTGETDTVEQETDTPVPTRRRTTVWKSAWSGLQEVLESQPIAPLFAELGVPTRLPELGVIRRSLPDPFWVKVALGLWVGLALLTAIVAKLLGRVFFGWLWLGLLYPLLSLLALPVLGRLPQYESDGRMVGLAIARPLATVIAVGAFLPFGLWLLPWLDSSKYGDPSWVLHVGAAIGWSVSMLTSAAMCSTLRRSPRRWVSVSAILPFISPVILAWLPTGNYQPPAPTLSPEEQAALPCQNCGRSVARRAANIRSTNYGTSAEWQWQVVRICLHCSRETCMVDGCTSPATVLVEHEFSCGGGGFEANIPNDQFVCDGHAWKMTNSRSWQFLGVLTLITGAVVAAFFARIGWHQASMSGWVLSGVGLLIMLAVAVWQEKNAMSVKSAYRTSVRGEFGTVWEDKVIEGKCTQVSSTFSKKATPSRLLSQGFVFNSVVLVVATAAHVFIAPPLPRDLAKPADLPQAPRVGYAAGDAHWRTTLTREFHDGWADHAAALQYIAGLDQWTLRSATHQIGFVEGENSFSVWVDESPEMSCFAVSPDGQLVGIGDDSGKVRVLSRADGHLIGEIQLTDALPITHLVFPETGPLLAIVTGNNFHVWDRMANASVLRRSVHCDRDRDIQLSPDGTRVIWRSVTDDLYIADLATAEKIQPIAASKVTAFDYCWQRELLVTTSQENRQVTFFRGPSFQCVGRLLPSFVPQAISLSVDGQFLAMSVRRLNSEEPNELLVWNLEKNAADWLLESRANNSRPVVDISPVIRLKDEFHSEEPIQTFGFGNDNRLYVVSGSTFRVREFVSDSRRGDWVSVQLQRTATGTASTSGPPNPGVSTPIPLFRESRRLLADATTLDEEFARVAEKQLCQIRESELPDLFRYLDGPCPTFANLAERAILKADVSCDVKLQMLLPELRGEDQQRQGRSARMISSLTCDISTETLLDVASYFLDALLAPPESQADQTGGEQSGRWTQLAQVMSRLIDAPRAGSAAHDARVVGIVSRLQQLHEAYRDTDHAGVAEQLFVQSGKWLLSFEQIDLRGIDELLRADRLLATSASLRQFAFQQSVALPESEMSSRLATMLEGPHGELRLKAARHLAQSNIPVTPIGVNILAAIEDCRFRAAREEATPELVDLLQCLGKLRGDALPALPHVIKLTKLAGKEDERAAAQRTVEVLAPHFTAEIVKMLSAKRPMSQQDLGSKLRLLPQLGSSARSAFEPMFEALRWQTDDTLEDSTVRSNVLTTLQTLQQLKAGEDLAAGGDLRILVTLYFASGRAKSNRQVRDASIDFLLQAGREGVRQVLEISNKLRRNDGRLEEIQSKIVDHHETVVPTLRSALKGDTAGEPPWNRTAIIKTLTLLGPAAKAALPELRNELTDRKISPAYSKLVQDALNAISSSDSP